MYGLILENLADFIRTRYGDEKWEEVRRAASVDQTTFSSHHVYPENLMPKLVRKAIEILNIAEDDMMSGMGEYFLNFIGQYGYDRVLTVLGRHFRDFINGLDNLHEYLRFSYPRMRAPSFFCENESSTGLTLHYRSKRRGFVYYTMGQIKQVGKHFYQTDIEIEVIKEEMLLDTHVVTFQLRFDNQAYMETASLTREEFYLPVKASLLLDIFPFCIIFGSDMVVKHIGTSLRQIVPQLEGQRICDVFDLARPMIEFKFLSILKRTNNIFEMTSIDGVISQKPETSWNGSPSKAKDPVKINLKGQMMYMAEWKMMMYLATPIMPDLDAMVSTGLYLNDLSMHDFSRDLMLAGTQQSVELKLALDQEQQKSKKLEESMRKLDEEMKRTDELLYQMIPKIVADRLRRGTNPVDTCQVFDMVTILFSDIVTFTEICSRIPPMQVVSMLNTMYSLFDRLTEINGVYKVETIGDAYMVVGGAPERDALHACKICDMALDMVDAIKDLKDPSTGEHLQIRVGIHSGTVVAGVVGLKMPRYCLFGDSVNTASRMESTSSAMKIHISESTKILLGPNYETEKRGNICVKGKGEMETYWLHSKRNRQSNSADKKATRYQAIAASNEVAIRGYSPVTMDDVTKRAITASPVLNQQLLHEQGKEFQTKEKNSAGQRSGLALDARYLNDVQKNNVKTDLSGTLTNQVYCNQNNNQQLHHIPGHVQHEGKNNLQSFFQGCPCPYVSQQTLSSSLSPASNLSRNLAKSSDRKADNYFKGIKKQITNEVGHFSPESNAFDSERWEKASENLLSSRKHTSNEDFCCPNLMSHGSHQGQVTSCVLL